MRHLFYITGTAMLTFAGLGIGALAWWADHWNWYLMGLPLLWSLLAGGWALLAISSQGWFRLRAGHAVALGAVGSLGLQLFRFDLPALIWTLLALAGGLAVAWKRGQSGKEMRRFTPVRRVQPPLSRRG